MKHCILFKVAANSSNMNSFGLTGSVFVSRTGLACEIGLNYLNLKPKGTLIRVPVERHDLRSAETLAGAVALHLHGEIPRALPKCPANVVREVFSKN